MTVPTGDFSSFIKTENIISPIELYKEFPSKEARSWVCVQFLAAINVYLVGDSKISKDSVRNSVHNLSMQALSRSNDRIQLKFTNINLLYRTILDKLLSMKLQVKKKKIERI